MDYPGIQQYRQTQNLNSKKMPGPILPAVIGAGAGLLGNLFNIGKGKKQHKRNIDLWERSNKYNHPSAQMARLREAGLNPNLIYGDSVSGASGTASSPPASAQVEKFKGNPIMDYVNIRNTGIQADNLRARNTLMEDQSGLTKAQTMKTIIETELKDIDKYKAAETLNDIIFEQKYKTEQSMYKSIAAKTQMHLTDVTLEEREMMRKANVAKHLARAAQAGHDASNAEKLGIIRDLEIELKGKNISYYDSNQIISIIGKILGMRK